MIWSKRTLTISYFKRFPGFFERIFKVHVIIGLRNREKNMKTLHNMTYNMIILNIIDLKVKTHIKTKKNSPWKV